MNKKFATLISVFAIAIFAFALSSCDKDMNVNAEWKDITTVFGLLDQNADTHYVKINKAFLGEADAYDMAQVRDSSEYENLTAYIEEWKDDEKQNTYILQEIEITNKKEGVFYAPNQTVYYFAKSRLDSLATYKLIIIVGEGTAREKTVTSETEIIDGFIFGTSYRNWTAKGAARLSIEFAGTSEINDQSFKITTTKDAKRYEVYGIFNYEDVIANGDGSTTIRPMSFEIKLAEKTAGNANGEEEINFTISGEQFFSEVGKNVPIVVEGAEETIVKRIVENGSFQIRIAVAGDDLNTYMEVNEPTTGIVQQKKEFTNITNGIGVFSCRTSTLGSLRLGEETIREIMSGRLTSELADDGIGYTSGRRFCNNDVTSNSCESCNAASICFGGN
ncbi:MAG: DUF4249 family protein [Flavobacteriales bacterium]|nr:DUF4249 family protein [Flavobacteriales bacterium]